MKVTRRQLRRIICEYYEHMLAKGHVDGAQWSGTLENLAMVQSKTWGHGAVVDPKGWHEDIKLAGRWTQGTVNERRLRRIVREAFDYNDAEYANEMGMIEYNAGREDAQAGLPPGDDTDDYMWGYNEVMTDMGKEPVEPPAPGSGEPLNPDDLQHAHVGGKLQELGKGWQLSDGSCNTHNISANDAAEAMATLGEFGYELGLPPAVDSNNIAINDALAAYPGEFSYEDFLCAIRVTQGRGA